MPLTAFAQPGPPAGPPPEIRAQMDKIRSDGHAAAFNALTADHKVRVQAIVDAAAAGKISDPRAAVQQIDAILSPDETKSVLAAGAKMHADMRALHDGAMSAPTGAPPATKPIDGPERPGRPGGMRNDAGFVLLMTSLTREQMHAAMPHPSSTP
ncbi:MAG: hypothetical protein NVSMB64_23280 [Candidatus Velthaea sp.]